MINLIRKYEVLCSFSRISYSVLAETVRLVVALVVYYDLSCLKMWGFLEFSVYVCVRVCVKEREIHS